MHAGMPRMHYCRRIGELWDEIAKKVLFGILPVNAVTDAEQPGCGRLGTG